MASTYSTSLRLELMATGEKNGTWGTITNTNLGTLLEQAIGGFVTVNIADANYTLTTQNGGSDEARNAVVKITSALTAQRTVTVPAVEKTYIIKNATTGGYDIRVKASGGSELIDIPNDCTVLVHCDGSELRPGPNLVTSQFTIQDSTDTNKRVRFDVSGVTTGNTRTFAFPDNAGTLISDDATQTLTNKTFGDNLAMGSNRITGLAAGTALTNAANVQQVQEGLVAWCAAGGTADVITGTYSPVITALTDGMVVRFRSSAANATTTPTFQANATTARTIIRYTGEALKAGDIPAAGYECWLVYQSATPRWVLMNPFVQRASTAEVLTGTDADKAVTPDSLNALWGEGANLDSSVSPLVVGDGGVFSVTGTSTITDIDFTTTTAGRTVWLKFNGALTLTHHATNLILPGAANITTAAGDWACFVSMGGDVVRCVNYERANGKSVVPWGRWRYLETLTASSSATLPMTDVASGAYQSIRLTLNNFRPATDDVGLQVQVDVGGGFITSGYAGRGIYGTESSYSVDFDPGTGGRVTPTGQGIGNVAGDGTVSGTILLTNFGVARKTAIFADLTYGNTAGNFRSVQTRIWNTDDSAACVKARLKFDSGDIATGTVVVEGLE